MGGDRSSIFELSEKSVRNRSQAQDIPDFTRGAWKTTTPDTDLCRAGRGFKPQRRSRRQRSFFGAGNVI